MWLLTKNRTNSNEKKNPSSFPADLSKLLLLLCFCKNSSFSIFSAHLRPTVREALRQSGRRGSWEVSSSDSILNSDQVAQGVVLKTFKDCETAQAWLSHGTASCPPYNQCKYLLFHLMTVVYYSPAVNHHQEPRPVSSMTLYALRAAVKSPTKLFVLSLLSLIGKSSSLHLLGGLQQIPTSIKFTKDFASVEETNWMHWINAV